MQHSWLNYHHLLYFKTIAETGSLVKASEVLRVGQSALSMQLKLLEERLERPLFERKQKKLILTEAGTLVLQYAQEIFGLGEEMLDTVTNVQGRQKIHVKVGVEEGVPHFAATRLLEELLSSPGTMPSVTHGAADSLVQDLVEHRLDLLLLLETPHTKSKSILFHKRVMSGPLVAVAAPKYATLKKSFPASLAQKPLLLQSHLSRPRHEVERFFHDHDVTMQVSLEVDETTLLENLAKEGHGITFLPASCVAEGLKDKTLVALGEIPEGMELWVAGLKRKTLNPAADRIMQDFFL